MTTPIRPSEATLIEVRQALQRIELNRQTGLQNNFTASTDPAVTDDESSGYSAGSFWFNETDDQYWFCTDATTGAAVWVNFFGTAESAGSGHNFGIVLTNDDSTLITSVGKKDTLIIEGTGGVAITGDDGTKTVTIDGVTGADVAKFFQGTFLESFDALVIEDGGAVKMTLEQSGGGDLTMRFSDGYTTLDCTPILDITLTKGADAQNPQMNFVYILQSAKVLAVSTTGWPAAEHIKVAPLYIQTNIEVAARGALINQNINDHAASTAGAGIGQGHFSHIAERTRRLGAIWVSGAEGVATQDGNDLWVSIAAGVVSQMHLHAVDALDSDTAGAGDPILVVNDPDAAYTVINSLNSITKLSDGSAIGNNKYLTFVLWAVANKSGALSPIMINLPAGEYNTAANAITDVQGHANFTIPAEFKTESTTGFLVAAFVCQHTSTAMLIDTTIDQRGNTPSTATNAGTGGGDVSAAAVIADNAIVCGDGGAKGVQDRTATIADNGVMSVPGIGDGGLTNYDLKLGDTTTPDYGMLQLGNSVIGRTSYSVGAINLDGTVLFRNIGGPVTGEIEFIFTESVGNTCRFAIPKSAVGNATYNPRSMLIAGPAPADTDFVKVSYWQTTNSIFHNLACDTSATGADLGVQNDLEVEGDIYTDSIKESTPGADIAFANNIDVTGNIIVSGTVDGVDIAGTVLTAAAVIADNALVRGHGGSRGTQGSVPTLGDTGILNMSSGYIITTQVRSLGDLLLECFSVSTDTKVSIRNSDASFIAHLEVEGDTEVGGDLDMTNGDIDNANVVNTAIVEATTYVNTPELRGSLGAISIDALSLIADTTVTIQNTAAGGKVAHLVVEGDSTVGGDLTVSGELGGELDAGAHTIGFTQQSATGDGTTTIDWKLGNKFKFTFGAQNDTFTFTAPTNPCNILLMLVQDGTGSRTATWPATVEWTGGTAPVLSTAANAVDIVVFYYDGTNYFGGSLLDFS